MSRHTSRDILLSNISPFSSPSLTVSSAPVSPNPNANLKQRERTQLQIYQDMIGDINAPSPSPGLYHEIIAKEHQTTQRYWVSAISFCTLVASQVILCLGITVGAQMRLARSTISELAAINTAVAASIAVMKGFGMPEKKNTERARLRSLIERIKFTTGRLRAGVGDVDVEAEVEVVKKVFESAMDGGRITLEEFGVGVSGGVRVARGAYGKV